MALPAPHLDDRTFQSLVDDAKRMVQQRCPEWTDHNVSDPGVTLIETFAYMVDQLLWRLNRVPDRTYIKFLDLIGTRLQPPAAATTLLTYWLTTQLPERVVVPAGSQAATDNSEGPVFTTVADLEIVPCTRQHVATEINNLQVDRTDTTDNGQPFYCFDKVPQPGDTFYIGLDKPVPGGLVAIHFECQIEGVGVDPRYPPLVWEAWDGDTWVACELERDDTGGLNRSGDVVVYLPQTHASSAAVLRMAAGWVRCRVVPHEDWQPAYSSSPRIDAVRAGTIGGSVEAVNADIVREEIVGISEGVAAQRFPLQHKPVVRSVTGYVVEVSGIEGWQEWTQVDSFGESGPDDAHFMIEEATGEIVFGPGIRETDGTIRWYGKVPEKGGAVRIREYRVGGGSAGNVAARTLTTMRAQIPFVASVTNRAGALGGLDAETVENAKLRGPMLLRSRNRAVTQRDYEHLAVEANPKVARARCVPAGNDGVEANGVRVLIIPQVDDGPNGSLDFAQLLPAEEVLQSVTEYLDDRRPLGARLVVEPASYIPMSIVARMRAKPRHDVRVVESDGLAALYTYFHPVRGGPEGTGWPFGRSVVPGEAYTVLQRVPGVEAVEDVRLYPALPLENKREGQVQRIDAGPNELLFSWDHQIQVRPG